MMATALLPTENAIDNRRGVISDWLGSRARRWTRRPFAADFGHRPGLGALRAPRLAGLVPVTSRPWAAPRKLAICARAHVRELGHGIFAIHDVANQTLPQFLIAPRRHTIETQPQHLAEQQQVRRDHRIRFDRNRQHPSGLRLPAGGNRQQRQFAGQVVPTQLFLFADRSRSGSPDLTPRRTR
jgi:hypothetical protein